MHGFDDLVHVGLAAGEAVDAALKAGDFSAAQFAGYGEHMCRGIEAMRKLVYTFYDHAFSFREFVVAHPDLRASIGQVAEDLDLTEKVVAEMDKKEEVKKEEIKK